MPAPTASTIAASERLYNTAGEPWADMDDFRTWANGGYGNLEGDFDDVRFIHLPRPQLYGFPNNEMLGEMQDCHGQQFVLVPNFTRDVDLLHRVSIYGDVLDESFRARVPTLCTRFRMPTYGRVTVEAAFGHDCWSLTPYADFGSAAIGTDPTAYFSLWFGTSTSRSFTEILGTRRHTRRRDRTPYSMLAGGDDRNVEPSQQFANMLAALSTKSGSTYEVAGDTDVVIFVALTAPRNTFFSTGMAGGNNDNRTRVDIHNASLMVRVWKNISN